MRKGKNVPLYLTSAATTTSNDANEYSLSHIFLTTKSRREIKMQHHWNKWCERRWMNVERWATVSVMELDKSIYPKWVINCILIIFFFFLIKRPHSEQKPFFKMHWNWKKNKKNWSTRAIIINAWWWIAYNELAFTLTCPRFIWFTLIFEWKSYTLSHSPLTDSLRPNDRPYFTYIDSSTEKESRDDTLCARANSIWMLQICKFAKNVS